MKYRVLVFQYDNIGLVGYDVLNYTETLEQAQKYFENWIKCYGKELPPCWDAFNVSCKPISKNEYPYYWTTKKMNLTSPAIGYEAIAGRIEKMEW